MEHPDFDKLKELRRHLHANPELSGAEEETSALMREKLEALNPDKLLQVGGTGLLVRFRGKENGPVIMVRGDMDALPIEEENDFEHVSKNNGVSHKCGHDGHTTILFGLAQMLQKNPLKKGTVWLLFQPSEENGQGAQAVIDDKNFEEVKPDFAFALHNIPGEPLHQIIYRNDNFTPAVTSILLKFKGRTSHAAQPERGNNPAVALANTLLQSLALAKNDPSSNEMTVITPVYQVLGEKAYGTNAGYGELHLTVRTWQNDLLEETCKKIESLANNEAQKHGLKLSIDYTETFKANINHPKAVEFVKQAAHALSLESTEKPEPFRWGEDFGLFTQNFKGCMFGLGAGQDTPALHNPDYDFPDEITETGVKTFYQIIQECIKEA